MASFSTGRCGSGRPESWRLLLTGFGAWAALSSVNPVSAETVELRPVTDTSLMEVSPDHSNGGQAWLLSGTTQNFRRTRAIMRFDFNGLIPPDVIISSVRLVLELTRQPSDGYNPAEFGLHRMLQPWGEGSNVAVDNSGGMGAPAAQGDATWNERFAHSSPGQFWSTPGGGDDIDFFLDASSQIFIYGTGDSPYTFSSSSLNPQLISDVQQWLSDPASNFGWMLKCEEEDVNFTARRFASREAPGDLGPRLYIEYQVVPEPGTLTIGTLGLTALFFCLRRRQGSDGHSVCYRQASMARR